MNALYPVILSGGSGTRLWPLSRGMHPKQFMDMDGGALFAQSVARAAALPDSAPPIVICNDVHRFLAAAILQEQGALPGLCKAVGASILLEPEGRNTAPAITLGALAALDLAGRAGPADAPVGGSAPQAANRPEQPPERIIDPLILVLSSDHVISPQAAFAEAVQRAVDGAEAGKLIVFGVPPLRPETGFGYIKQGRECLPGLFEVERFLEKPARELAESIIKEGGYLWNSGMFLFRASVFLEELAAFAPTVHENCLTAWQARTADLDFTRFPADAFAAMPSISVDYAVMERTKKAGMVPLPAQWNDMGSWEAFYESAPKDEQGNAMVGDVISLDSAGCYLHSSHRLVAALGLRDLSVVETPDAVLALPRSRSQDVKLLLERLKQRKRPETDAHVRVYRPWGSYEVLVSGDRFQVKRIMVKPGAALSLQLHHHRAEHWVVVRGTAKVTLGREERILKEDESTYIPLGVTHRLENPGRIPVEIIEIQTGSYLGEDDIVRFEDTYGRTGSPGFE